MSICYECGRMMEFTLLPPICNNDSTINYVVIVNDEAAIKDLPIDFIIMRYYIKIKCKLHTLQITCMPQHKEKN